MSIAVQSPIETVKTTLKKTSRAIKITGNPKIFLIGMPGAGKTYWAEKLRSTTKIPSYDLDAIVEVMEERTIKDIFAEDGEDYFRKAETKMLRLFSDKKQFIVATGGGTPCHENNMQWMNKMGTTIWIDEPLNVLKQRLLDSEVNRPLLLGKNEAELHKSLEALLNERSNFYGLAKVKLDPTQLTENNLIEIIQRYA